MKTLKNYVYNLSYQILIMILPLITAPYIARILGADSIGIYSYTHSVAYYFVLFAQLGLNVYGNRTIASVRSDKKKLSTTFSSLLLLQFIISTISSIAFILYILFISNKYNEYLILQIFYVISSFFDITWFFFGMEEFKSTVIKNTLIKIISVILILTLVKQKNDLYIYCLIMSISTLVGQVSLWIKVKKHVTFCKVSLKSIKPHLKPVIILFLPTVATSFYRVMDKVMLGSQVDISQLGFYENSEKFIAISLGVINALGTVMIPKMSNLISTGDIDKVKDYINKSMEGIYILSSPIVFGLLSIADVLSIVFYGNEFIDCTNVIKILSISILFSTWANVIRTQYLVPYKKDKEYIISMFSGAIINVIINFLLIPKFGAIGASIGTVLAEFMVALMHSIYVKNKMPLLKYFKMIIPYILMGIIMWLFIINITRKLINVSIIGLLIEIITGGILYMVLVLLYLIIFKGQYFYILKDLVTKRFLSKKKEAVR